MSSGWRWFAAWALAGALLAFAFLTGFSIGLFVLPFALLALVLVARWSSGGGEMLGAVTGAGLVCLLVAALADDPGDSAPWLLAGLAFVVAGVLPYAALRRRAE
jgi:hypothetical protein